MGKLAVKESLIAGSGSGLFPISHNDLQVDEKRLHCIIRLQALTLQDAQQALQGISDLKLPAPGMYVVDQQVGIVWTSHNEWLIFAGLSNEQSIYRSLVRALDGVVSCVTVISDSRVCFRLTGSRASSLIAKCCALDSDPSVFTVGSATITRFSQSAALVIRESDLGYLCYVDSPVAMSMAISLAHLALEFS